MVSVRVSESVYQGRRQIGQERQGELSCASRCLEKPMERMIHVLGEFLVFGLWASEDVHGPWLGNSCFLFSDCKK